MIDIMDGYNMDAGVAGDMLVGVAESIINNENFLLSRYFIINFVEKNDINYNNLFFYIDNNYPILIASKGHITVAFNSTTEVHNGYKLNNRFGYDMIVNVDNEDIEYAMVLEPTEYLLNNHVCSNNYVYNAPDGMEITHCPCELAEHPAHIHQTSSYTVKENEHNFYCEICKEIITENHEWDYDGDILKPYHEMRCKCGKQNSEPHNLIAQFIDSDRHRYSCKCGINGIEEHRPMYIATINGGYYHLAYCLCSMNVEGHNCEWVVIDGERKWICSLCVSPECPIDVGYFEDGLLPWYYPWGWGYIKLND